MMMGEYPTHRAAGSVHRDSCLKLARQVQLWACVPSIAQGSPHPGLSPKWRYIGSAEPTCTCLHRCLELGPQHGLDARPLALGPSRLKSLAACGVWRLMHTDEPLLRLARGHNLRPQDPEATH